MAGRFRYIFDDFYELADEPLGWEDVEIVVKRNEDSYGGLFATYMTEFQFWGDGYAYINQQIQNLGYCFSTKVAISYQCTEGSGFESVFIGFINISNAEVDNEKCLVKANIERDDIYTSFLKQSNTEVNLQTVTTYLPDGTGIIPVFSDLTYHAVEDGTSVYASRSARAYKILDAFNFMTAIYTQDRLPVVSNFFTNTPPVIEEWEIEITGAPILIGETISVTVKNYFGITFTKSQLFTVSEAQTLINLGFKLVNQVSVAPNIQRSQVQQYFDSTSFANVTFPTRKIVLESWLPIEIVSVEITGGVPLAVPAWNRTIKYQKGGKDLYVLTQYNETQLSHIWTGIAAEPSPLSFKELFLELDKIYALGLQLQGTPDNYVLRIEPLEYFYSQPAILRLQNVMNITSRFESDKAYNQVQVGSGYGYGSIKFGLANGPFVVVSGNVNLTGPTAGLNADQYILVGDTGEVLKIQTINSSLDLDVYVAPTISDASTLVYAGDYSPVNTGPSSLNGKNYAYTEKSCIGNQLSLVNDMITDIEVHGDQTSVAGSFNRRNLSASNMIDRFCLLQCNEDAITTKQYKYILNNAGEIYERYAFNGHMTNHHKIINNYIHIKNDVYVNAGSNTEFQGQALRFRNDASVRPVFIHEFEHFLSFTDIMALVNDPQDTIEVDLHNDGSHEKCWVYEIRMNINTKKAKFAVYTN